MVFVLQDHVAAHRDEQGIDALPDDLLDVRALHQCGEQFNELQGHAADPMRLFDLIVLIRLEAPQLLVTLLIATILTIIFLRLAFTFLVSEVAPGVDEALELLDITVVAKNLGEDRQVHVH